MVQSDRTLLVIDDVEENRDILKRRLEKQGYHIEVAGDGQEGLLLLNKKRVSLILLDLNMPVMNGFTFLEKVKNNKRFANIPVVIATSFDDEETANDCLAFGASGYITKPYDMQQVMSQIDHCLAS
ncbi:MAG: response regulator [Thioalkalispiraceae bacterium]|jgi:CheY-like chemotaxis protein